MRYHAAQAIVIGLLMIALSIVLMWRAYLGKEWEVPVASGLARTMTGEGATP